MHLHYNYKRYSTGLSVTFPNVGQLYIITFATNFLALQCMCYLAYWTTRSGSR